MRIIFTILAFSLFHFLSIAVALGSLENDNKLDVSKSETDMINSATNVRSKRRARDTTAQSSDAISSAFNVINGIVDVAKSTASQGVNMVEKAIESAGVMAETVGVGVKTAADQGLQTVGAMIQLIPIGKTKTAEGASPEAPPPPEVAPVRR